MRAPNRFLIVGRFSEGFGIRTLETVLQALDALVGCCCCFLSSLGSLLLVLGSSGGGVGLTAVKKSTDLSSLFLGSLLSSELTLLEFWIQLPPAF